MNVGWVERRGASVTTRRQASDFGRCIRRHRDPPRQRSAIMAHASRRTLQPLNAAVRGLQCSCRQTSYRYTPPLWAAARSFHRSHPQQTDGVFRELTSIRVRTPWVEALRKQQAEGKDPTAASGEPKVPKDRELKPKRMDDSYHSVILPLAQDPWLLDTYLNSSGHIRLGTIFMDLDALSGVIA